MLWVNQRTDARVHLRTFHLHNSMTTLLGIFNVTHYLPVIS